MNLYPFLLSLALKSTVVLGLAWVVTLAMAKRSAAARHTVWSAAFAALLALPLLSVSLPSWSNRFATAILPVDSGVTFHVNANAGSAAAPDSAVAVEQAGGSSGNVSQPVDARRVLSLIWAGGGTLALLHMLWGYVGAWRLRRMAIPSPHHAIEFGIDEPVDLLEIPEVMPMTVGVWRPAIFLPAESAEWSRERLQIVVEHEYAHVRRGDAASQLMSRAALCLYWYHPLAWFGWQRLLSERELAADDLVLASGARATDYAGHLLEIARTMQALPAGAGAGIAMARKSQLEGRLMAILDSKAKRGKVGRAALAVALMGALAVAIPLATVRAQSQTEQMPQQEVDAMIAQANARKNHEMLEQSAVALERLRKFADAQKLREAALQIRKDAGRAQYAEGLVRLGDLAQKRNQLNDARAYYLAAVEVGDMPETAPALLSLGLDSAFFLKNVPAAIEYLQRARNAAKNGNDVGRAMTWQAFLQNDPLRESEAEGLYRSALSMEDPGSREQALTSELLARFLRKQGRDKEAEPLEQSATAMRKALAAKLNDEMAETHVGITGIKVGGGVTAPRLLYKMEPSYTEEARALKVQGTVLLKVVIDVDGMAKEVQVVKGVGTGLDEKAVEAVLAWKFKPGEQNGVAVPVQAQIEVNFRLL